MFRLREMPRRGLPSECISSMPNTPPHGNRQGSYHGCITKFLCRATNRVSKLDLTGPRVGPRVGSVMRGGFLGEVFGEGVGSELGEVLGEVLGCWVKCRYCDMYTEQS